MAKKKQNKSEEQHKEVAENYYELKTDAVDRLVNADKKVYDNPKANPGKQYKSGILDKIPSWVLALFMKFWFNGAVCFFIFWGLGLYITDMLDMIVVMSVILGMITDLLVNNAFRFFETYKGQNSKWMMFPQKKYWTFLANIPYAFIVLYCVMYIYNTINVIGNMINGTENAIILGVEPILFGLFYMAVDMCFIGMKNMFVRIVKDAKEKNGVKSND